MEQRLQNIERMLGRLNVGGPSAKTLRNRRKRQRRRGRAANQAGVGVVNTVTGTGAALTGGKRNRRNRNRGANNCHGAEVIICRTEVLSSVSLAANAVSATGDIQLTPATFSFASKLASIYERWRSTSMSLRWKPYLGGMADGSFAMGVCWDAARTNTNSRKFVSGLSPWVDVPIRNEIGLALPGNRLMSRLWYNTQVPKTLDDAFSAGHLYWSVDGLTASASERTVGEILVTYTIQFSGTTV